MLRSVITLAYRAMRNLPTYSVAPHPRWPNALWSVLRPDGGFVGGEMNARIWYDKERAERYARSQTRQARTEYAQEIVDDTQTTLFSADA